MPRPPCNNGGKSDPPLSGNGGSGAGPNTGGGGSATDGGAPTHGGTVSGLGGDGTPGTSGAGGEPAEPDDCPDDPAKVSPGECGCGVPEATTAELGDCHGIKAALAHRYDFEGNGTQVAALRTRTASPTSSVCTWMALS